jgi:hypothetical protein
VAHTAGRKADPVIAVDKGGRVLRSFGKGLYKIPHAIRLDPEGNVWTVDAGSSTVINANARILEYTADGKKVREWGSAGAGPGQFHLPHSIVADENNILYVADRENGRIEKFDLDGEFLGEIPNLGRTYSLKLGANGTLWAGMQPLNEPPGAPGWVVKLDRRTGKILGYVPVSERAGLHSVEDAGESQPMTDVGNRVVWYKRRSLRAVQ